MSMRVNVRERCKSVANNGQIPTFGHMQAFPIYGGI